MEVANSPLKHAAICKLWFNKIEIRHQLEVRFARIKVSNKAVFGAELTKPFSLSFHKLKERLRWSKEPYFRSRWGEKGSLAESWTHTALTRTFRRFREQMILKALTSSASSTSNFRRRRGRSTNVAFCPSSVVLLASHWWSTTCNVLGSPQGENTSVSLSLGACF